jgi:hypothetical protein
MTTLTRNTYALRLINQALGNAPKHNSNNQETHEMYRGVFFTGTSETNCGIEKILGINAASIPSTALQSLFTRSKPKNEIQESKNSIPC